MKILLMLILLFSVGGQREITVKQEKVENNIIVKNKLKEKIEDENQKSKIIFSSVECDSNMKLWINETYNFKMCIFKDYMGINSYKGSLQIIKDNEEFIGLENGIQLSVGIEYNNEKGKYDEEIVFGNKKIIKHYVIDSNGKKEFNGYFFDLKIGKNKYYSFGFDKKTEEIKKIISSIKVLNKSKLKDGEGKK